MAITLDAISNSGVLAAQAAGTFVHTVGVGSNPILLVASAVRDPTSVTDTLITSATYGGTALTKIRRDTQTVTAPNESSEFWYILNPGAGSANVIINYTGSVDFITAGAISLFGVDQTTPIEGSAGNGGVGGSATPETSNINITTANANEWLIGATYNTTSNATRPLTAGVNQNSIYLLGAQANADSGAASYKVDVAAGANSMSYTWDGAGNASQGWAMSVIAVNPAAGAVATFVNLKTLMGIGS